MRKISEQKNDVYNVVMDARTKYYTCFARN